MENKICNPKTPVPKGIELNDEDYMTILLNNLKELVKNMTVALTEVSNSYIYKEYKSMYDKLLKLQRAAYELMFKNGWYTLEDGQNKINTTLSELEKKLEELS